MHQRADAGFFQRGEQCITAGQVVRADDVSGDVDLAGGAAEVFGERLVALRILEDLHAATGRHVIRLDLERHIPEARRAQLVFPCHQ